jgi:hypothetical protein
MDKDLALAFEFENAPDEVKAAAIKHRENYFRFEKSNLQSDIWNKEKEIARKLYLDSQRAFNTAVKNWLASKEVQPEEKEKPFLVDQPLKGE